MKITKTKLLEQLSPMYNVVLEKDKDKVGRTLIVKDGIKFGFLQDKELHFIDDSGEFSSLDETAASSPDSLLFEATKAFWSARALKVYS